MYKHELIFGRDFESPVLKVLYRKFNILFPCVPFFTTTVFFSKFLVLISMPM